MAKTFKLNAEERKGTGKGAARAVRREGKIPAVIYGGNDEPVSISLTDKELNAEYQTGNFFTQVCEMKVGNDDYKLLGRDIQLDPVTDRPLHVDFLRVTDKTRINVSVGVTFMNEEQSPGITDEKGTLVVTRYEVEVVCRAVAIPDELFVDLDGTQIGDNITSKDIKLGDGVEFAISDRDFAIAAIVAPKTAEELEAELEADTDGDVEVEATNVTADPDADEAEGDEKKPEGGDDAK